MKNRPRPVRVLLTTPHLMPTSSPYREMMAIARHLPRDEFKLSVCCFNPKGGRETEAILESLGVESFLADFRPRGSGWTYLRHLPSSIRDQAVIDRHGPFQIQHSLDSVTLPFEALIARRKARRYVYNQGNMNEYGSRSFLRVKVSLANRIIAISDAVVELLRSCGAAPRKVRKVYLGIDLEETDRRLRPGRVRRPGLMLSVGQVIRRKRLEDAIEALALVSRDVPDSRLWIAGGIKDNGYHGELQDLARARGLEGRVEFLGVRSDVLDLMQEAQVLVHCAEREAFGWVLVEAMAARLPVIAAAVDGPREILENGVSGFLVESGAAPAYAEALRLIFRRPEAARLMAEKGRRRVEERFSAETMVREIAGVYRELTA